MRDLSKEAMFIGQEEETARNWGLRFHFLTCLIPIFRKKCPEVKSPLSRMNKNGFSEVFRCKEFASSRRREDTWLSWFQH